MGSHDPYARDPMHSFRCKDEIWLPALEVAALRGEPLSAVLRAALVHYVHRYGAEQVRQEYESRADPEQAAHQQDAG